MKMKSLNANTKKDVEQWIFDNCFDSLNGKPIRNLYEGGYNVTDDLVINGKQILIQGDDTLLPFKFGSFESFVVNNSLLQSCANFPKICIDKQFYEFIHTNSITFNDFPTNLVYRPNIHITFMRDVTVDSIYSNKSLETYELSLITEYSKSIFDFSTYNNINTYKCRVNLNDYHITNLSNVLNIHANNLSVLEFHGYSSKIYEYYDIDKINNILTYYMKKMNRNEFVMDFALELIDSGFEDIV